MVIYKKIRLATGDLARRRAQTDPQPQVPLTNPIRDPASCEHGTLQDHLAQVLCRSVLVIIYEQIGFAIPIDIGDSVRIMGARLPARHGAILAGGYREAGSVRLEQFQVGERPIGVVEEVEIGFAIAIEIADEVPIAWCLLPVQQGRVVALHQRETPV